MKIKKTLQELGLAIAFGLYFGLIAVWCTDIYFEDIARECEVYGWRGSCKDFARNLHPDDPILSKYPFARNIHTKAIKGSSNNETMNNLNLGAL